MTAPPPPAASAPRGTRCWTLRAAGGAFDVQITANESARLGDVLPVLAEVVGRAAPVALWAGSNRLSPDLPLGAPAVAHGAVLGLDRPGPRPAAASASALELRITGGPEAGRAVALERGRHVLGRGSGAQIDLRDPDVSRRHAIVEVGNGGLTVADLGSTNGTRLAAATIGHSPQPWPMGVPLRVGATTAAVSGPPAGQAMLELGVGGRTVVRPAARLSIPPPEVDVVFPHAPEAAPRRRLPWVATALPAVGGVLMALFLHTPTFLFFAVLGPLMAVGSWLSDRWSGRRSGRREAAAYAAALSSAERRLAEAVLADVRAVEQAHPDLATLTSAARRRAAPLWSRRHADGDALTVRLGIGPGLTRVTRVDGQGARTREPHPHLPVALDLRTSGGLGVVGPRSQVLPVLSAVVGQLVTLHAPGEVDLVLLTDPDRVAEWGWARWLPHLDGRGAGPRDAADAHLDALLARRGEAQAGERGWLVVVLDREVSPRLVRRLRGARDTGVIVLAAAPSVDTLPAEVGAVLAVAGEVGEKAVLTRDGSPSAATLVADGLQPDTAAALARDLAALEPAPTQRRLRREVSVLDAPGPGLRWDGADGLTREWSRHRDGLVATLGWTAQGPLQVDLCRAGPHTLVAGTTGSGKSELLQTLIASLALAHPPDRCSFLLVDYKGGAAFAEAAALPHTVGVLTDLDGQSTARALRSLTAELTRREALLGEQRVADITDLPGGVALARLVIVVDEFATLSGDLPEFMPGLVAIAQRGRSLGVHLVLATQRPSGVVSGEIRANCTLRICLRTTDEGDSRDVLGIPDAARLPIDVPGRAYVRTGSGSPVLVQVARVHAPVAADAGPRAHRWVWPPVSADPAPVETAGRRNHLARLVAAVGRRAARDGIAAPHRPWLPPLPDRVVVEDLVGTSDRRIPVGVVDRPDVQAQDVLELDLDRGGGWLVVGGPGSGRTTLLRTVLAGAVAARPPNQLHVHVVDHGGGGLAREAALLPHRGTCVGRADALRTVRLLDRLTDEVQTRRSGTLGPRPRLLLLVDGAESVLEQLDELDPGHGSTALLRLVRDGAAVGLTCVLTADRAIPGGRLAAVATERLVLPLADRADYAVAGVPGGAVPGHRPPGRALLGDAALECQLAVSTGPLAPCAPGAAAGSGILPLRIADLPPDPVLEPAGPSGAADCRPGRLTVVVGPGGDEGLPLTVDLTRTGGLLVVGPPASGRSTLLAALALELIRHGVPVLGVGREPPAGLGDHDDALTWARPWDVDTAADWLAEPPGTTGVVIADDVGAVADWPVLTQLGHGTSGRPPILVAAGTAADLTGHYQGTLAALRRNRSGVLLCPGPAEADLLGLRLPRTPVPVRPGSGWLAVGGRLERVQVARRRPAAPTSGEHRRSGPVPVGAVR